MLASASAAVTAGQGLPMIGKPLGQTVTTTARYTPPAADPGRAAANQVAQSIVSAPFVLICYPLLPLKLSPSNALAIAKTIMITPDHLRL
jgi:hypothetical protein